MKVAELSDADRRLIQAGRADIAKSKTRHPSTAAALRDTNSWTCRCGERFTAWAPAERHARDSGHRRLALTISRQGEAT